MGKNKNKKDTTDVVETPIETPTEELAKSVPTEELAKSMPVVEEERKVDQTAYQ
jgi:hypothetical protein